MSVAQPLPIGSFFWGGNFRLWLAKVTCKDFDLLIENIFSKNITYYFKKTIIDNFDNIVGQKEKFKYRWLMFRLTFCVLRGFFSVEGLSNYIILMEWL